MPETERSLHWTRIVSRVPEPLTPPRLGLEDELVLAHQACRHFGLEEAARWLSVVGVMAEDPEEAMRRTWRIEDNGELVLFGLRVIETDEVEASRVCLRWWEEDATGDGRQRYVHAFFIDEDLNADQAAGMIRGVQEVLPWREFNRLAVRDASQLRAWAEAQGVLSPPREAESSAEASRPRSASWVETDALREAMGRRLEAFDVTWAAPFDDGCTCPVCTRARAQRPADET